MSGNYREYIFVSLIYLSFLSYSVYKNKENNKTKKKKPDKTNPISCKIIYYDIFPCCGTL